MDQIDTGNTFSREDPRHRPLRGQPKVIATRLAASLVMALLFPLSAAAQAPAVAPPGNSAVNQYLETVPTAHGGRPSDAVQHASGTTTGDGRVLVPSVQRALVSHGSIGQAIVALAASTGSRAPAGSHRRGRSAAPATVLPSSKSLIGSSGGSRLVLAVLVIIAVGGGALAMLRRRSTS